MKILTKSEHSNSLWNFFKSATCKKISKVFVILGYFLHAAFWTVVGAWEVTFTTVVLVRTSRWAVYKDEE